MSTICKVIIKVIGVNNEEPVFEKNYVSAAIIVSFWWSCLDDVLTECVFCVKYGNHSLAEDAEVGTTVLTIKATDTDEPDTGSSYIMFDISNGNDGDVFTVETDGKGVGYVVIAKVKYLHTSVHLQYIFVLVSFPYL